MSLTATRDKRNEALKVLALVCTAAFCLGGALASAKVSYFRMWQQRVPNGAPVGAHFGDRIVVRPLVAGTISFTAYPLTVQKTYATHADPAIFNSSGNDTYEVLDDHDGALDVRLDAIRPMISPWFVALLLLCALLASVLAALVGLPRVWQVKMASRDLRFSATLLVASFALFMLVPRYLHNDELGGGINWGYLGWGYVDTLHALPQAIAQGGLLALITVESLGKPIIYPLIASPLMSLLDALNAAILASAVCTAFATLGIYRLGCMIFDRWAGLLAAALFAFSPLVLAYATAFYLDIPYVAFFVWSAVFLIGGLKAGNRTLTVIGVALGVLAVGVRNPIMAALYFLTIMLLMLAARIEALRALKLALLSALAAFLGAVFLWPFLWVETASRLPFVLVARLLFDQYYHLSAPPMLRIETMVTQTFVHTDPLTTVLFLVGVASAITRRDVRILWLTAGVGAARLFVAPTSFYLQHYWFYMAPFLQLVAGSTIALVFVRFRRVAIVAACAAVFGWSVLYFPYPASAALGCWNFACSVQRWGVDEPVFGLKEAAEWIRPHVPRGAVVGALAAPHVLQVQLEGYPVRFITLPPDRKQQEVALSESGVRYLVTNAWSRYTDRERVLMPQARLVWRGPARAGLAEIFELRPLKRPSSLDAPSASIAQRLLPEDADRIVVYPRSASYHGAFPDRQVVTVSQRVHPLTDMRSLLILGGGIGVFSRSSDLSAFDYEQPIRQEGAAASYALPSLAGMQPIAAAPMTRVAGGVSKPQTTVFSGVIEPHGDERFFTDIFEVRARADKPFSRPETVAIGASCGRANVALSPVWIDRGEVRGYAASESALSPCIREGAPLRGYLSLGGAFAPATIRASVSLLWNGDNAFARVDRTAAAMFSTHPIGNMRTLSIQDDLRAFIEARPAAAVVVPSYQTRFDLEASGREALSDRTTLLKFSRPTSALPAGLPADRHGCVGCASTNAGAFVARAGSVTWVWILGQLPNRSMSLALDVSTLRVNEARLPQAVVQVISPNGRGCAQWDLGPMGRGHILNLLIQRFSERGCRLTRGTQLAFVLYAPRDGMTVAARPLLRVLRN